ncbi:opioid growth factor receptor isoform X1 [Coregonus clupeaformis]|uniref:opioid growth factor receptor isoform X1 n=1 Tax=Coregonus clupeaformis TaxID=59861 RepID=UPI001BDF8279|nr:opioid growth factor receptor isoform X1 [Coregonus clupeaformis]
MSMAIPIGRALPAIVKLFAELRRKCRTCPRIERLWLWLNRCYFSTLLKRAFWFLILLPIHAWRLILPNCLPDHPGLLPRTESLPRSDHRYDIKHTDDYYCNYDSTWKNPTSEESSRERTNNYTSRSTRQRDDRRMPNLQFYRGQRASSPDGVYIDDFHNNWYGKYSKLEAVHSYIQWLFPLQERGMNYQAKELTKKEIEAFLEDETVKKRLVKSYKLMLDFYGIQMSNDTTGEVRRANNWRDRFDNMDRHTHNNLRITRILKCLGTLGFPHYQAPLVRFFLEETLVKGQLYNVKESVLNYFIFAVIDKQQRRELVKYAYEVKHELVSCPKKIKSTFREGTFPDYKNPIDLKLDLKQNGIYSDDSDDNTTSHQSVSLC